MLLEIITFVLDVVVGFVAGACLLRLYMQHQRVPFGNPVGRMVFALTDWLVLPLRRLVPAAGRWDLASLVAALLLELAQYALLWLLLGASATVLAVPLLAGFGLARLVLSGEIEHAQALDLAQETAEFEQLVRNRGLGRDVDPMLIEGTRQVAGGMGAS